MINFIPKWWLLKKYPILIYIGYKFYQIIIVIVMNIQRLNYIHLLTKMLLDLI